MNLSLRTTPTFYFVGVSTAQSSIMKVFPKWANILGVDAQIAGIDAPLHAPPETYRAIVQHIKSDPNVYGALVTTHKIDLFEATRDLFEYHDPNALLCGEISCISKRDGQLRGHAKDPISSGLAWKAFVPEDHFARTNADVLCFGSGGAAVALSVYLASAPDRPRRFTLVDISESRLEHARLIHAQLPTDMHFEYVLNSDALENDRRMSSLPPGLVVVNATGMGKDRPGSPVTDAGIFPQDGFVWEMNYRGELNFLHQAQQQSRNLKVEDGWVYFLHGWTQVIAEVFNINLTPELFARLDDAAR